MELQVIEKSDHDLFLQNLIKNYQVEGVKKKDGGFFYGPIKSPKELCLDFDRTILPPKKYFLPPQETILRFTTLKVSSAKVQRSGCGYLSSS